MSLDYLKREICLRTGIPQSLLTATNEDALFEQARGLLAFKRENSPQRVKDAREQFAAWMHHDNDLDYPAMRLEDLQAERTEQKAKIPSGSDPANKTPREQFAEWVETATAPAPGLAPAEELPAEKAEYPAIRDGDVEHIQIPSGGTAREQFSEWASEKLWRV